MRKITWHHFWTKITIFNYAVYNFRHKRNTQLENSKKQCSLYPIQTCVSLYTEYRMPTGSRIQENCSSELKDTNRHVEAEDTVKACAVQRRRNMICSAEVKFVRVADRKLPRGRRWREWSADDRENKIRSCRAVRAGATDAVNEASGRPADLICIYKDESVSRSVGRSRCGWRRLDAATLRHEWRVSITGRRITTSRRSSIRPS